MRKRTIKKEIFKKSRLKKIKPIKNAIISAYDKEGIESFCKFLQNIGANIYSTGNTAKYLKQKGIDVKLISDLTGFPEIFEGRVKTLHPVIHGGILARRDNLEDLETAKKMNIPMFDLVYINLYPFEEKSKNNIELNDIEEFIDIGGPTMLRAAAKNYQDVIPIVSMEDLQTVKLELLISGKLSKLTRLHLAAKVFNLTSYYDSLIHNYFIEKINKQYEEQDNKESLINTIVQKIKLDFNEKMALEKRKTDLIISEEDENIIIKDKDNIILDIDEFFDQLEKADIDLENRSKYSLLNYKYLTVPYKLKKSLRYGENPHQSANFYIRSDKESIFDKFIQINGKELSYNNIKDIDVAWKVVSEFKRNTDFSFKVACCGVKHNTPCSVALGEDVFEAYTKMYMGDSVSIFGGIVAINDIIDEKTAKELSKIFLEIIVAVDFTDGAFKILKKKKNLRLLKLYSNGKSETTLYDKDKFFKHDDYEICSVDNGLLVQNNDDILFKDLKKVTLSRNENEDDIKNDIKNNGFNKGVEQEDSRQKIELEFGYIVAKYAKSNAIVVTSNFQTLGIGSGQQNRISAAKIALENAKEVIDKFGLDKDNIYKEKYEIWYLSSDGFFPFDDVVKLAAQYPVKAIIQPGGSIRDNDSIEAAKNAGIDMYFAGVRHFKH